MPEWSDMSISGMLFQLANTIKTSNRVETVQNEPHHLIEKQRVIAVT